MPDTETRLSLQDRYAPRSICFGCGPANARGLRIRSFPEGDGLVTEFTPEPHQQAFEGAVNGGIIGVLFDCHCNWTAAWHLMQQRRAVAPPPTVTAEFSVRFRRPTPSGTPLTLRSRVVESREDRATVEATIEADGTVCATSRGTFVEVKVGHPAYHRWE
ncbi:MAG TPA: PaaI family thioesterase [Vicinamibacterales bacterium]|jgi:acyl-coenzyme A thioesterase PaaI-like protein